VRTGGCERRSPAVDALARLEPVARAGDVVDRAVAQVEQQACGARRAAELVDGHDRHRPGRARLDGDERDVGGQVDERLGRALLRRDDEDAVDPLHAEALDRAHDRRPVERVEADDRDEVARGVGGLLDREQRRRRPVQRRVEAHDAERVRAPGHERARRRVRPVVELAHRGEHAAARLRPHVRAVVDDPRHGLVRDAGELGDVGHHGRPAAPVARLAAVPSGGHVVPFAVRSMHPAHVGRNGFFPVSVHRSGNMGPTGGVIRPHRTTPSAAGLASVIPHSRAGRPHSLLQRSTGSRFGCTLTRQM
jgi:hypothetical protein